MIFSKYTELMTTKFSHRRKQATHGTLQYRYHFEFLVFFKVVKQTFSLTAGIAADRMIKNVPFPNSLFIND